MAADATLRLTGPRVHPDQLVADHAAIAVQDLAVDQPVGGDLDEERSVGCEQDGAEHAGVQADVCSSRPAATELVCVWWRDRYRLAFDDAYHFGPLARTSASCEVRADAHEQAGR